MRTTKHPKKISEALNKPKIKKTRVSGIHLPVGTTFIYHLTVLKRGIIMELMQQIVPQNLEGFFDLENQFSSFNNVAAAGFQLSGLVKKIKSSVQKDLLLKSELELLDTMEDIAGKLKTFQRRRNIDFYTLLKVRHIIIKAFNDRLDYIQEKILENLDGLEAEYGTMVAKMLFIIESIKTIIKIHEANYGEYEKGNAKKRMEKLLRNPHIDKTPKISENLNNLFKTIISASISDSSNTEVEIQLDNIIKYDLRRILTKQDLLNYRKLSA